MFDERGGLESGIWKSGRMGMEAGKKPAERQRTALDSTLGSWVINSPFFFYSLHLFVDSVFPPVRIVSRVRLCGC